MKPIFKYSTVVTLLSLLFLSGSEVFAQSISNPGSVTVRMDSSNVDIDRVVSPVVESSFIIDENGQKVYFLVEPNQIPSNAKDEEHPSNKTEKDKQPANKPK